MPEPHDAREETHAHAFAADARLGRRATIGAAGAGLVALVAGCTNGDPVAPALLPGATVTPPADPDVALAAAVLTNERRLLARLDATLSHHPALRPVLAPARAVHGAHAKLLADAAPKESSTPTPSSSPLPSGGTDAPVPGRRDVALRALASSEHALSLLDQRSALAARSGAFARVLGSMAGAAAQQASTMTLAAAHAQGRQR